MFREKYLTYKNLKSMLKNYISRLITVASCLGLTFLGSAQNAISVSSEANNVTQNFNTMYDASTSAGTLTLPDGWYIERQLSAPRTVGAFSNATSELMYEGGTSLASNAKNGTWNFGASDNPSDRAIGGLSTTVANGTRCVNLITLLHNSADKSISKFTLDYDIEKYRKGDNAAGFAVQLFYSTDGENWVNAGENFYTLFSPDNETLGAEIVPIETVSIADKSFMQNVEPNTDIYLAWNISVASGASPNKAMGLAIDNININVEYKNDDSNYIYVEDVTGWNALTLYATGDNELFGTFPGSTASSSTVVNGVTYKVFEYAGAGNYSLQITNNGAGKSLPEFAFTGGRDYYLCATSDAITEIADPSSYTGWVDPSRPPFVSSGIYLRGEVNSWGASADWEFSNEGDNTYVLYDKTISGTLKIADANWSSACNYGSNGSTLLMDTPYTLVSGTDSNISCGSNTYACSRIVLSIVNGTATLLLESNDDASDLSAVYIIGDNNEWNYMSTSGQLSVTETENVFKGRVTMSAGTSGNCQWRLYQRLGMSGVWGAPGNVDATANATSGSLEKGSTGKMSTAAGTYDVTFNIATGEYSMEEVGSYPVSMTLQPQNVILVPSLPEKVKILSLNNSLIHYNDQAAMFNEIAAAMGKDAVWTKHTMLGKPLSTHFNEGDGLGEDGTPTAKMLIRNEAWSHIILQEQSALPRTNIETFRTNVKEWIDYIREYCPNPNAIIILPMNWAYSGDWENFTDFNSKFNNNYLDVARDLGVVICPVAMAYQAIYNAEGADATMTLYSDDRHPTPKATYLAACMEYSLIFGEDANTISHTTATVTADEALQMRNYASSTMSNFTNIVDHNAGIIRYSNIIYDQFGMPIESENPVVYTLSGGGSFDSNNVFTSDKSLGQFTLTATNDTFTSSANITVTEAKTEVIVYPSIKLNEDNLSAEENFNSIGSEATATLPDAWRIDRQTSAPRTVGTFPLALTNTAYSGGVNLPSNATNGLWNFGATDDTDRALGGISTGVDNGTRCVNLYAHLYNDGATNIEDLVVSYDIEKYRKGSNAAGFAVQLYYSIDGRNFTSAGENFYTYFAPDTETAGYDVVPGETVTVSDILPATLQPGCDLYLAWNISVASGDAANAAMAIAIDNFSIAGSLPEIPDSEHYIYVIDNTGYEVLALYAWGTSELFGAWPGQYPVGQQEINGNTYKVFTFNISTEGSYNLIFNNGNNGQQLPDYNVTEPRDYYFVIDSTGVNELESGVENIISDSNNNISVIGNEIIANGEIYLYNINGQLILKGYDKLNLKNVINGVYIAKTAHATKKIIL